MVDHNFSGLALIIDGSFGFHATGGKVKRELTTLTIHTFSFHTFSFHTFSLQIIRVPKEPNLFGISEIDRIQLCNPANLRNPG